MQRSHSTDPMTLGNMRENGVHRLWVSCWNCRHDALLDVSGYPDSIPVPAFGPRTVCTTCGIIGADARPNWQERPARESLTGAQLRTPRRPKPSRDGSSGVGNQ